MDNIVNLIPEKWRGTVLVALALLPYIGRGYHALRNGGGLKGVWNGVLFGTNAPAANAPAANTPPPSSTAATAAKMTAVLLLGIGLWAISGCAPLRPGADPIVVRAEQVQTVAQPAFQFILRLDDSDRGFWKTNAPALHSFCEWLRQPQVVDGLTVSRAAALWLDLDDVKLAYKSSKASSNTLFTVIATVDTAVAQASGWAMVATNTVPATSPTTVTNAPAASPFTLGTAPTAPAAVTTPH